LSYLEDAVQAIRNSLDTGSAEPALPIVDKLFEDCTASVKPIFPIAALNTVVAHILTTTQSILNSYKHAEEYLAELQTRTEEWDKPCPDLDVELKPLRKQVKSCRKAASLARVQLQHDASDSESDSEATDTKADYRKAVVKLQTAVVAFNDKISSMRRKSAIFPELLPKLNKYTSKVVAAIPQLVNRQLTDYENLAPLKGAQSRHPLQKGQVGMSRS